MTEPASQTRTPHKFRHPARAEVARRFRDAGPLSPGRTAELERLYLTLGYRFRLPRLLDLALTHSSSHNGEASPGRLTECDNESLEFLGDSILSFVISEYLVSKHPRLSEGELTRARASLVSTRQLSELASHMDLGRFLRLGKGEEKSGGRQKRAILADLFEAIVAAVYIDGGIVVVRRFIRRSFRSLFRRLEDGELELKDYKTQLQELLHRKGIPTPAYDVIEESGPDHQREFTVAVVFGGCRRATGKGRSKKEASQSAARKALEDLVEGRKSTD